MSHPYTVEEQNRALCELIGRPRSVLDIGCGIGENGRFARGRGAHVVGLERAESARAYAREALHEVLDVDIEDRKALGAFLGERSFDLVILGDVLEHLRDPRQVLADLVDAVAPGTHFLISLPNVATWPVRLSLLSGKFDYQSSGVLDRTHLRFFTLRSATELAEASGLEVMRVAHNPMLVRALKPLIARGQPSEAQADPRWLARSLPYKLYQGFVRPVEDVVTERAPGFFAFQHVLACRKPPVPQKLSLTVGMLTMDEEPSIAKMIGEVRKYAPDAKILCVDSSRDRTPEIAASLGARVLRQWPPRGHGPAMELLMYSAAKESEALIYLDCDFTYPPSVIPEVRRLLEVEAVDVVNCARTRSRPAAMPLANFLANRSFAALAHGLHGVPTVDVHSGMRGYRSSAITAFDFDGEGDALPIDTLLWPAKCGYRVVEMPIAYDERVGVSKLRKVAGTVWTGIRLAKSLGVGTRERRRFEVR